MQEMKERKRSKRFVRHHIINKCNKGKTVSINLIKLEEQREKAWHYLFKDRSFKQVATILLISEVKFSDEEQSAKDFLFGNKTQKEIAELLLRVDRCQQRK